MFNVVLCAARDKEKVMEAMEQTIRSAGLVSAFYSNNNNNNNTSNYIAIITSYVMLKRPHSGSPCGGPS